MKKTIATVCGLCAVVLVFMAGIFYFSGQTKADAISAKVGSAIDRTMEEIAAKGITNISYSADSNPYHYMDGEHFQELVALGPEAIPAIRRMISDSGENGLREYLLAIAVEEIAKTDIRRYECSWATAQEFLTAWDGYLDQVDTLVEKAMEKDTADRAEELGALGLPALPKLFAEIEDGDATLVPVVETMAADAGLDVNELFTADTGEKYVARIRELLKG